MNKKEVLKRIGMENWKKFDRFMEGQTIGINDDGSSDFYDSDVERFESLLERRMV